MMNFLRKKKEWREKHEKIGGKNMEKELTTKEIFEESMKLSEPAYKEKERN